MSLSELRTQIKIKFFAKVMVLNTLLIIETSHFIISFTLVKTKLLRCLLLVFDMDQFFLRRLGDFTNKSLKIIRVG